MKITPPPSSSSGGSAIALNPQSDNYTLALSDAGKRVTITNASAKAATVPPNSAVTFPLGTVIELFAGGAGQVSIAPGAGVTIESKGGALNLAAQYSAAVLTKIGTDTWTLVGDITT